MCLCVKINWEGRDRLLNPLCLKCLVCAGVEVYKMRYVGVNGFVCSDTPRHVRISLNWNVCV